jgi:hypothetical protein
MARFLKLDTEWRQSKLNTIQNQYIELDNYENMIWLLEDIFFAYEKA